MREPGEAKAQRSTLLPPRRLFVWDPEELGDWGGRALQEVVEKELPFDGVQIRIKQKDEERFQKERERVLPNILEILRSGRTLWVNRNLELARKVRAHGLVMGRNDPPPPLPYGYSIHGAEELLRLPEPPPLFLLYGHIYPTPSKPGLPPRGLLGVQRLLHCTNLPVLAIGGITPEREEELLLLGVYGVATIRNYRLWQGIPLPSRGTLPSP